MENKGKHEHNLPSWINGRVETIRADWRAVVADGQLFPLGVDDQRTYLKHEWTLVSQTERYPYYGVMRRLGRIYKKVVYSWIVFHGLGAESICAGVIVIRFSGVSSTKICSFCRYLTLPSKTRFFYFSLTKSRTSHLFEVSVISVLLFKAAFLRLLSSFPFFSTALALIPHHSEDVHTIGSTPLLVSTMQLESPRL